MPSTRQNYNLGLETLSREIMQMGHIVNGAIEDAITALVHQNSSLAHKVIASDDAIDNMQIEIEDKCMVLIARQQPIARDLRIVGTGLKITTDLERMGDHAVSVARVAVQLAGEPLLKPLVDLPRMAQMARTMLRESLEAYMNLDISLAEQVCNADDEVDNLYQQVFRELLTYMMEKPSTIGQAAQLLFVARYLERIADHATNIAEWVSYLVTGQRMRKIK